MKWGWMYEEYGTDVETIEGPFETREAALDDAQLTVNSDAPENGFDQPYTRRVVLGHAIPVNPENVVVQALDFDWFMERMNEDESLCGFDDNDVIDVICRCEQKGNPALVPNATKHTCGREAEEALHEHLKAWAREHLTSRYWYLEEQETVELHARPFGECDWDECDEPAVGWRKDTGSSDQMLPVCKKHQVE